MVNSGNSVNLFLTYKCRYWYWWFCNADCS